MNDQNDHPDFSGAADTLAQAQEVMQRRRDELASQISLLTSRRKAYLASTVADLLPTMSPAVLENLLRTVPTFVTASVADAFQSHRKFLGVFARAGHKQALHLLQTRLAAHLDQAKFGGLKQIDQELSELTADRSQLDAQIHKALDLLGLMHQAGKQKIQLPAEASAAVAEIARVGRSGPALSSGSPRSGARSSHTSSFASTTSSSSSDNSDLWIYYLTDLPTSMRTLLISSIDEQRVNEAVARRHTEIEKVSEEAAPARSSDWISDTERSFSDTQSMVCTAETVERDMAGAAMAAAAFTIATDDRLGFFS